MTYLIYVLAFMQACTVLRWAIPAIRRLPSDLRKTRYFLLPWGPG